MDYKTVFKSPILNFQMVEQMYRESLPGREHLKMHNTILKTYISAVGKTKQKSDLMIKYSSTG